ncbi:hypothetical protein LIER_28136 [Lithospermum erythrorhizon]|uniref:Gag-pol polyprotein n=1 Tax=Lithospermum erythrorhizon TaxID=34254 RepID=A0AAV3RHI7_LITER
MSNEKLVRKVLRTLPKRFAHKVTAIEEARDLSTMGFDELIGILTIFEMMFDTIEPSKGKVVALHVSSSDKGEENLAETVNMECEGFGHIQVECPNYVKKQSKSYYTIPFDEETEEEEQSDNKVTNFVAFTARDTRETAVNPSVNECVTDSMGDEEAYTSGEAERVLLLKKNGDLMQCVERQQLEIRILEDKIQRMIKGIKMMNSSTTVLDEILLQEKRSGDNT